MVTNTSGQALIRGIDINKTAIVFGEEESILINFVGKMPTKNREMRWYQKTAGFLDSDDTTGITLSQIQTAEKSLPVKLRQSWTRKTSYIKIFKAESEMISIEDMKDNDVDVFNTHLKDIVRGVVNQRDIRIYSVLIEAAAATPTTPAPSDTLTTASTQDGWDDLVTGNPILDLMIGNRKIRAQGNKTENIIAYMNPIEHQHLMNYIISVKGSSIPAMSSDLAKSGVLMEVVGNRIVVSQNATTDNVLQFIPNSACIYREFMPLQSVVINEPLIGSTIRVATEGEAILVDPNKVHQITDTIV
ncbi:MAG: hypothetical protein GWP19_00325 [Planctomycetia bacterium]|nr:hypothetical protein [Planctomycetia bacterium]